MMEWLLMEWVLLKGLRGEGGYAFERERERERENFFFPPNKQAPVTF
jgi:hypothetical protein